MNKRTWHYIQQPATFDMACDKCGGINITWSEYEGMIWCYDCEVDTPGYPGIFDGPIPVQLSAMFGVLFDRFNMETQKIEKFVLRDAKCEWISEEDWNIECATNLLSGKEMPSDLCELKGKASEYIKLVPASDEEKESFKKQVLEWAKSREPQEPSE